MKICTQKKIHVLKHDMEGLVLFADQMGLGYVRSCEHPRVHGRSFQGAQTDMWGNNDGEAQGLLWMWAASSNRRL